MQALRTLILLWVTCFSAVVMADDGDDTLKHYLSKSSLVFVGKISEHPRGGFTNDTVNVSYGLKFSVTEVLQGDQRLVGKTIDFTLVRYQLSPKDQHPLMKKDAECILFLKQSSNTQRWETADVWFGMQPESPSLVKSLKRLLAEQQNTPPAK